MILLLKQKSSLTAGEICVKSRARDTFLLQYWGNIKGQGVLTPCVWPKHVSPWTGVCAAPEQWD